MRTRFVCAAFVALIGAALAAPVVAQGDLDPLLKVLVRKGVITINEAYAIQAEADTEKQAEQKEMQQELRAASGHMGGSDVDVDYKFGKGVTFSKGDANMNIGGRIQVRYDATDNQGDILSNSYGTSREGSDETFDIRRARLAVKGDLREDLSYKFQIDVNDDAELKDAMIHYQPFGLFGIKGGQYKVPFSREELNSSGNLQFVDRGITNRFFAPGRDVGISVTGKTDTDAVFSYEVGAWNGDGDNADNKDGKFAYGARVAVDPFGYFKPTQGDLKRSEDPKLSIGLNYLTENLEGADQDSWGLDVAYHQKGWSVEGEWLDTKWDADNGGDSFDADGWRLQVGYLIWNELFEVAARYAEINADFPEGFAGGAAPGSWEDLIGSNGVTYDELDALTLALNFYFKGHASKLQVDYTWLDETSTLMADADDLDNDVLRVQYQVKF